jgi:hypothetical protein
MSMYFKDSDTNIINQNNVKLLQLYIKKGFLTSWTLNKDIVLWLI